MSKHNRSRSQEQSSVDGQVQSGAPQGNRPANNARIATPGAITAPGWQGSEGAGDFLGLNQDLANEPAAPVPQSAPANPMTNAPAHQAESWLFQAQDPEPEEVHVGDSQEEAPPAMPQEATWREEEPPARRLKPMLVKCAAAVLIGMFSFAAFKVVVASRNGKPVDVKPLEPDKLSVTGGVEVSKPQPIESPRASGRKTTNRKAGQAPSEAPAQTTPSEVATVRRSIDPETGAATPQSTAAPEEPEATASRTASEPSSTRTSSSQTVASAPEEPDPIVSAPAADPAPSSTTSVAFVPVEPPPAQPLSVRPKIGEPLSNAIPDPSPATEAVAPATQSGPLQVASASAPAGEKPAASATEPPVWSGASTTAPGSASDGSSGAASWNGWTALRSPMDPTVRAQSRWSHDNPGKDLASFSPMLAAQQDASSVEPTGDSAKRTTSSVAAKAEPAPPVDPAAEQKAKMKELKGVWSDVEIPVDSISAPTKILTPNVGRVRAIIEGNEVFEGSLYAVGENTVWITSDYGRLGLSAARIVKLERLSSPSGTPVLGENGSQNLNGLDKVRIKTPGGIFVGKIVAREGDQTIIVTEDGVRITLPTKDVELVGENPRLVIKPKSGDPKPEGQKQP